MKIAISTKQNIIETHFDYSQYFTIFTIDENNKLILQEYFFSLQACSYTVEVNNVVYLKGSLFNNRKMCGKHEDYH